MRNACFFPCKETLLQSALGSGRGKREDFMHFKTVLFTARVSWGWCVCVRLSDDVSGLDGLIMVNCFSLTSCSEGWGRKRKES